MAELADEAIRQRAIGEVGRSMALSAGAGSGKTTVLTERLVRVLASGVDPSRIAAITFTEKAAGELQRRVRGALEARLAASPEDARLRGQLERFHALALTTIHSFCRTLLATEPLASRWAPGTDVAERDARGLARGLRRWRRRLAESDPLLLGLFDALLAKTPLEQGVLALIANRDLAPACADAGIDWEAAHAGLAAVRLGIEEAAGACSAPETDKLLANNAPLRTRLAEWCSAPAGEATLAALVSGVKGKKAGGRAADWAEGGREAFKEAAEGFSAWQTTWRSRAHRDLVESLTREVLPEVEAARVADGVASFDDLLFRAAALLREPDVRARLAGRFDALLIDEVQDTDPIQAEVAALLARDPRAPGDWLEVPPEPGRLFAVGDPKQSIYRFRRAEVAVWAALSELIARDGESGALVQNFRSVPGLVGWVNHVFAEMPGFEAQVASREPAALEPVVVIRSEPDAQFEHALRHLFALKEAGREVVDPETGARRPMGWGDVMVLVPRWANAPRIASLFERAGVDAVVEGGGAFFEGEEVRLGLSALRALDEPGDTEAVVHVLLGLFGLTLEDLARHVAEGGALRVAIPGQPAGPVRDALEVLRELGAARVDSWVPVLDQLLDETRASAVWAMLADGHARLANLDKLRALIRETEATSRSPSEVVSELVAYAETAKEEDLSRADVEHEAVRITSIFKAKGLEAPIVVLLDMARQLRVPDAVPDREARRLSLKIGANFAPPGWDEVRQAERAALMEERQRWMYVACTRARDQLVIVHHDEADLLRLLERGFDPESFEHEATQTVAEGVRVRIRRGEALPALVLSSETFPGRDLAVDVLLAAPPKEGDPEGEAFRREAQQALRAAKRRCARPRSVGQRVSAKRAPSWGSGIGKSGGTLVHRALEHLDLGRSAAALEPELEPLVAGLALELGVDEATAGRCAQVVRRILAHPVLDAVRAAPEHWKETPFAFVERGRVVHGVIDLCFPEDEARTRWVVVDWKSDLPPEGHPVRTAYARQVGLYARAVLATVTPCAEVRPVLVGPHPELPAPPDREQVVLDVHPDLRGGLRALLDAGAPLPAVGLDVGEPILATLELAWEEAKVGLGLDLLDEERGALAEAGWQIEAADTAELGWARAALAGLRARLGLEEDADDASSVDPASRGEGEREDADD